MTTPLNPNLFHSLQTRFSDVRTSNAGQQQIVRRVPDPMRPGRSITQADQRGEQYAVPCPFCDDHKPRLYVSYKYGQKDPITRRPNYRLWCCQNEKCHQSEANRTRFRCMVAVPLGRQRRVVNNPAAPSTAPPPQEVVLPDGLIPINSLPPTHPATAYLLERGFDLTYLAEAWGIAFCDSCLNCVPAATHRIVIPIYRPAQMFAASPPEQQQLVLGGWQARIVPGLQVLVGENSKYLFPSGMRKSELLYGLHQAAKTAGPVYLVEGPSDCWRIGPGAVALFGKTLSTTQKLLMVHHFAGRPIVVLLDADARESAQLIQRELAQARLGGDARVVVAHVPSHCDDPADCTREEIIAAATVALGQQTSSPPIYLPSQSQESN